MAREESVACDLPGCTRHVGQTWDHIQVHYQHTIAQNDLPQEYVDAGQTGHSVYNAPLDFCSLEHLAEWVTTVGDSIATRRSEALAQLEATKAHVAPLNPPWQPSGA
jgi:hypothetical protein